jgi:hypothetical protein
MQNATWENLTQVIEQEIDPLLKRIGYSSKAPEDTENGGFYLGYMSNNDNLPQITIHTIKIPNLEYDKQPGYVSFLRVYLGAIQLKTLQDTSKETHSFLTIGWIYADDAELLVCIQEIVEGLKRFFNLP